MAADPANAKRVAVAVQDKDRYNIRVFQSTNGGRSYGELPEPPTGSYQSSYEPTVAYGPGGNLFATFGASSGGRSAILVTFYDQAKGAWERPRAVARETETQDRCVYLSRPQVAVAPDRVVHVVWESAEYTGGCARFDGRLYAARATAPSYRFTEPAEITLPNRRPEQGGFLADVRIAGNGAIVV